MLTWLRRHPSVTWIGAVLAVAVLLVFAHTWGSAQIPGGKTVSPRDFGARADGRKIADARIAQGENRLCSAGQYRFGATDIGKAIVLWGAGEGGAVMASQIAGHDGGCAILAARAAQASSGMAASFGTDDTKAVQAALEAAMAAGGSLLVDGSGAYFIASHVSVTARGGRTMAIRGNGTFLFGAPHLLNPAAGPAYVTEAFHFRGGPAERFVWSGPRIDLAFRFGNAANRYFLPGIIPSTWHHAQIAMPAQWNYGALLVEGFGNATVENQQILGAPRGVQFRGASGTQRMNVTLRNSRFAAGDAYGAEGYLGYNLAVMEVRGLEGRGIGWSDPRSERGTVVSLTGLGLQRADSVLVDGIDFEGMQYLDLKGLGQVVVIAAVTAAPRANGLEASVTTRTPHLLQDGSKVCLSGVEGLPKAPAPVRVTVVDASRFTFLVGADMPNFPRRATPAAFPGTMAFFECGAEGRLLNARLSYPPGDTAIYAAHQTEFRNVRVDHSGDFGITFDHGDYVTVRDFNVDGALQGGVSGYDVAYPTIGPGTVKDIAQPYAVAGRTPNPALAHGISFPPGPLSRLPYRQDIHDVTFLQMTAPAGPARIGVAVAGPLTNNLAGSPPQIVNFPGTMRNITVRAAPTLPGYAAVQAEAVVAVSAAAGTAIPGEVCGNGPRTARFVATASSWLWIYGLSGQKFRGGETLACATSGARFTIAPQPSQRYTGFVIGTGSAPRPGDLVP